MVNVHEFEVVHMQFIFVILFGALVFRASEVEILMTDLERANQVHE